MQSLESLDVDHHPNLHVTTPHHLFKSFCMAPHFLVTCNRFWNIMHLFVDFDAKCPFKNQSLVVAGSFARFFLSFRRMLFGVCHSICHLIFIRQYNQDR